MASAEVTDKVASMTIEGDQGEKTPQKSDGLYTSEIRGSDESGDGTPKVPYKTIFPDYVACVIGFLNIIQFLKGR